MESATLQTAGPSSICIVSRTQALQPSRAAWLTAAATLLGAATPLPPVPVYRQFGRWLVACDNTRACVAKGFDEVTRAELDLTRAAGEGKPSLTLSAEEAINSAAIRLDGKPLALSAPAWVTREGVWSTSDPAAVDAFVAAVRDGETITLDAAPAKDDQPRTVPLAGLTAALLLIDAVQGRLGTSTPLVAAKGSGVPPPGLPLPAAPRWMAPPPLTSVETGRLLQQAGQLHSPSFDTCDVHDAPKVFALDAASALAIRPCYLAAYQGSSVVAVLPRQGGEARPVKLRLPGVPDDGTDGPDMVDPEFDQSSGSLTTVSKGRGLADCGSDETWVWSNGAFRLKALNYQDQCGGTKPGDWPALYRTR